MCGIAGIFNTDEKPVDRKILHKMDLSITHRGPDGHGEMIDRNIGLANRRLAVIDPSFTGNQPMSSADKQLSITFNGEIFNFKSLRAELIGKGYNFRSHTDTETVLYGYREYGTDIVNKLIGQFAFCIWDKKKNLFFLARDQLGINPLYYSQIGKSFIFASEVKALLASGLVNKAINPQALHHFLSMFCIPSPISIFSNIKVLEPGHIMVVKKNGIFINKYWNIPIANWSAERNDKEIIKEKLRKHLFDSVKSACVSDVPVGAFLSGGIDSSSVVALMSLNLKKPVKTYSLWAEGGKAFDERKYARIISDKFNTDHTEFTVTEQQIIEELPKIIYFFDQPTGGSLETYFISKLASDDVKVALSGLGGDELFGGYHSSIHNSAALSGVYKGMPAFLRSFLLSTVATLPFSTDLKKTLTTADHFLKLSGPVKKRLFLYFAFMENEKQKLYSRNFLPKTTRFNTEVLFENYLKDKNISSDVDLLGYLDLETYTKDDLLTGMNMMSMANSLEVRVPFLDPRLIDFASKIPPSLKFHKGISKYILKEVAKEWLPAEVITHKKTGFGLPRALYMKGKLKTYILSVLSRKSVMERGFFNPDYIDDIVQGFYNENSRRMLWREHLKVWILFVLELWCRIYLDNSTSGVPQMSLAELASV